LVWYNETRLSSLNCELGVIIFGSVRFLSKKVTKPKLFFFEKKYRNRVKPTGFGSVRFGFLGQKPVQTGLTRFFRFWLGFFRFCLSFFRFGSVFPVWLGLFPVFFGFFGSVRFGFFSFLFIKPKPNRTGLFFLKFNRFNRLFFSVRFFRLFFYGFLGLIGFPVFLLTPTVNKCDDH